MQYLFYDVTAAIPRKGEVSFIMYLLVWQISKSTIFPFVYAYFSYSATLTLLYVQFWLFSYVTTFIEVLYIVYIYHSDSTKMCPRNEICI